MGILLTSMITVATVTPTWACTPPLHPPKMPDLEKAYDAAYEAGKKAAENVVIPDSYFKNETETTETEIQETETETETESETVETTVPDAHPFWDYYRKWFKWFR